MKSKNGCPFCRDKVIQLIKASPEEGFQAQCDNCGARGPIYADEKSAHEGWELGITHLDERMRTDL
ncbi:MAG: hypothetical protein HUN05_11885 [Desulfobacter sp.]|nr:MAG: hypothetical protein HUN05_11885 [Desulfobacter sp.]